MQSWLHNVFRAVKTVGQGMYVTLWYFFQSYRRRRLFNFIRPEDGVGGPFTQLFEYPELPVPVKPRYRGYHRFDLTTCIGCDKCARACPVDCIYIDKMKNPVGKGFRVNGFKIDYAKCMFCALCVDPCPVDCIFMGSTYDQSCFSRDGLVVDFARLPVEVAWGKATLNPTSIAASKLVDEPVWTKPPDPPPPPKPAAKPKAEDKPKEEAKTEEKPKAEDKPKEEVKPKAEEAKAEEKPDEGKKDSPAPEAEKKPEEPPKESS